MAKGLMPDEPSLDNKDNYDTRWLRKSPKIKPDADYSVHKSKSTERKRIGTGGMQFLDLPDEMMIEILSYLSATEMAQSKLICQRVQTLIENSNCLWMNTNYASIWPTEKFDKLFQRGAKAGNVECLFKLGIRHLYCYNLDSTLVRSVEKSKDNANKAYQFFRDVDYAIYPSLPTLWVMIRPPWVQNLSTHCCVKEYVYQDLLAAYNQEEENTGQPKRGKSKINSMRYSVMMITNLLQRFPSLATAMLEQGVQAECPHSLYMLSRTQSTGKDAGQRKVSNEYLKKAAMLGSEEAQIDLAIAFASGDYMGAMESVVSKSFQNWISKIKIFGQINVCKFQTQLNEVMRQVLLDWMTDVCVMKELSSQTFSIAVSCLDSYLSLRTVTRKNMQLVGITCLLLAAKFDMNVASVLTIRESAWLTDNTYTYEDVVKMVGEILSALKGKLFRITPSHLLVCLQKLFHVDQKRKHVASFLLDFSLYFLQFRSFKPVVQAASAQFLAGILLNDCNPWPGRAAVFTGLTIPDLLECVHKLYYECCLKISTAKEKDSYFKGIYDRYSSKHYDTVSSLDVLKPYDFATKLEVAYPGLQVEINSSGHMIFALKSESVNDNSIFLTPSLAKTVLNNSSNDNPLQTNHHFVVMNTSGYDGDLDDISDMEGSVWNNSLEIHGDMSSSFLESQQRHLSGNCCEDSNNRALACSPVMGAASIETIVSNKLENNLIQPSLQSGSSHDTSSRHKTVVSNSLKSYGPTTRSKVLPQGSSPVKRKRPWR